MILKYGGASSPDGDKPLPQSGHDVYSSIAPWVGWTAGIAVLLGGIGYMAHFYVLLSKKPPPPAAEDTPLFNKLYGK